MQKGKEGRRRRRGRRNLISLFSSSSVSIHTRFTSSLLEGAASRDDQAVLSFRHVLSPTSPSSSTTGTAAFCWGHIKLGNLLLRLPSSPSSHRGGEEQGGRRGKERLLHLLNARLRSSSRSQLPPCVSSCRGGERVQELLARIVCQATTFFVSPV